MNSIINAMTKYDHRQHELSDWLLELEQRFQLGEVEADRAKITWCQLLIGATGNSILAGLDAETTWEAAKETLLSRLGAGSVRDEAWAALKHLTRGTKEIIELAGEAEKLAKRLHPCDAEAAERHAVDAFLSALDRPLAAEVRKLGHTQMEGVVADARRIEKILQDHPHSRQRARVYESPDSDPEKGSTKGEREASRSNHYSSPNSQLGSPSRTYSRGCTATTSLLYASTAANRYDSPTSAHGTSSYTPICAGIPASIQAGRSSIL